MDELRMVTPRTQGVERPVGCKRIAYLYGVLQQVACGALPMTRRIRVKGLYSLRYEAQNRSTSDLALDGWLAVRRGLPARGNDD
jgi:hypothetical protein